MQRFDLNGIWHLSGGEYSCDGTVPGSVYSFLLDNKLIEDPYYRDNELKFVGITDVDFEFSRRFDYALDGNTVPILFVHGDADATVPPESARELYERAQGTRELHYVAGADHAESVLVAPDEYREAVTSFLETARKS